MICSISTSNAVMPDFRLHAPEQAAPGVVDVHRRQVGQRAAAPVLVLDEARPAGAGGDELVAAQQRLQLGLLVGADDVVARVQPLALPATLIEIQDTAGLGRWFASDSMSRLRVLIRPHLRGLAAS